MRYSSTAVLIALALTACNQSTGEKSPEAPGIGGNPAAGDSPAPAASGALSDAGGSDAGIPEQGIPAALRGRWGQSPADCEPGRGDAKGLMIVSPTTLTFYDSVGKIAAIESSSATALKARFSFSGEGMAWKRVETLELRDGGNALVRSEADASRSARGSFTYIPCPQ